ncbi:MAG: rod shape-determining protein MreD [Actinobacteria bacterium]|nr:rod shape-determining protein MreD [Actinomycetota bacterium]
MRATVRMAAALLVALVLDTVLSPVVSVAGGRPNLVVLTVVAFALTGGVDTGMRYGFVAGLASDALSGPGRLLGMSALVLTLVGAGVGLLRSAWPAQTWRAGTLVAAAASAAAVGGYGVVEALLGVRGRPSLGMLAGPVLGTALCNGVVAALALGLRARGRRPRARVLGPVITPFPGVGR